MLIFGYSFSIFSMIGLILLVGLAIKNASCWSTVRIATDQHGMDIREALLEAGPHVCRAIMMTSVTIAFALLPVALHFGEGAETRAPLAATVLAAWCRRRCSRWCWCP
jgi:multidrug efflux pump subunit AcrB